MAGQGFTRGFGRINALPGALASRWPAGRFPVASPATARTSSGCRGLTGFISGSEKDSDKFSPAAPINSVPLTSVMFVTTDHVGALSDVLNIFTKNAVSMVHIESRIGKSQNHSYSFVVDFEGRVGESKVDKLLGELDERCPRMRVIAPRVVPWFPQSIADVDKLATHIIGSDTGELEADHPGFQDKAYRARRQEIADIANSFTIGDELPRVDYTAEEIECWSAIYRKLFPLLEKHACREYLDLLPDLKKSVGYVEGNVPQLADVNAFVSGHTGFRLRPVAGLLSSRDFLYGLAFRIFFCTQYLRHHSKPLYTPEPDLVHELVGHAPMFANPEFADFSQQIGLASIGASQEQIDQLARCYWYTVEFGVLKEGNERKAYGAGLLSSFGEIEYAMSDEPEFRAWDPFEAAKQPYPITKYQPTYYVAESFADAKASLSEFAESLSKAYHVRWNAERELLEVDRNIVIDHFEKSAS